MPPLTVWKDDFWHNLVLTVVNNTAEGDPGITSAGIRCDTFLSEWG